MFTFLKFGFWREWNVYPKKYKHFFSYLPNFAFGILVFFGYWSLDSHLWKIEISIWYSNYIIHTDGVDRRKTHPKKPIKPTLKNPLKVCSWYFVNKVFFPQLLVENKQSILPVTAPFIYLLKVISRKSPEPEF